MLLKKPLTEEDGVTPLRSFIGPMDKDSLIDLPASHGFGYVMELVDTKAFLPVLKLWHHDTYPDIDVLCQACINIAKGIAKAKPAIRFGSCNCPMKKASVNP